VTRTRPTDRLDQLVEHATRVFTALGYRRTQMADIAREMGVAPGTLYLYVESKEALFDFVVQRALADESATAHPRPAPAGETSPPALPIPAPPPGATLEQVRRRLAWASSLPQLDAALARQEGIEPRAELEGIVRELYETNHRYRRAKRLIAASALDWPELAAIYYVEIRRDVIRRLARYLETRIEQRWLRPVPDAATATRLILETVAWFARHRYGAPDSEMIRDDVARETVVHVLVNAFCLEGSP
jgi:AcrR family transcriptional regulator